MARKPMTDEQKENARNNLAKARAARQQKKEAQTEMQEAVNPSVIQLTPESLKELLAEVASLAKEGSATPQENLDQKARMNGASIENGRVTGEIEKYPLDAKLYTDPTPRLYDVPELQRFAPRQNFTFTWEVDGVHYENKAGVHYAEPRFTVKLFRNNLDEDGKLQDGERIRLGRLVLLEDENAARIAARKLGIEFDSVEELMEEMRFERVKQWAVEALKTVHGVDIDVKQARRAEREMVVDGKVYVAEMTEQMID